MATERSGSADRTDPSPASLSIDVVLPALDEERSLPLVLGDLPRDRIRRIVVADNGSADRTAEVARELGAEVVPAARRGYGSACLAGLGHLRDTGAPDIVVFLDADYSDHPDELGQVVAPILSGEADLVIGSRLLGRREPGALLPQARVGNVIACTLIRCLYGHRYTDLGPFRAIRWSALERLDMRDPDFGWTAEMQVKAVRLSLRVVEVPVSYRRRVGVSKITGTVRGSVLAGIKILTTVARYARAPIGRPSRDG
ncbi:MAG: glycosyltransferase family 2 protein [Acidobacteriota bacterium]